MFIVIQNSEDVNLPKSEIVDKANEEASGKVAQSTTLKTSIPNLIKLLLLLK